MTALPAALPVRLARLVRIEHTIFALPFAFAGALLATDGWPGWAEIGWITLAMVGARTLAMGLNRLIDAEIDARNPRTAVRELPSGQLHRLHVVALCAAALGLYLLAAFELDPVVRWLWPVPVALLAAVGSGLERGTWYWVGAAVVAGLLSYEHGIVRPGDLRRLDAAFFTVNGILSIAFGVLVALDTLT